MKTTSVDLFVIGGGSGGVRAARVAAQHGASVAIAEEHRYGGTCVIRGCIPKKLFVYASEVGYAIEDAAGYGWKATGTFDWRRLLANKDAEIDRLNQIYLRILSEAGVEVCHGRAVIEDAHTVTVGDRRFQASTILVATGGAPHKPDVPGAEHGITSNHAFHLDYLPRRVTLVGGGYIGLEFAGIFQGLGVQVTLVHHRDKVLRGFDDDVREHVTANLRRQGVELLLSTEVAAIEPCEGGFRFRCTQGDAHETDLVMFTTGRRPNTAEMGLTEAGVVLDGEGAIVVDDRSKSSVDSIYAIGDCTSRPQLTPVAIRDGQAFADTVFGGLDVPVNHAMIPTAIFSHPPVGTVGMTEGQARARGPVRIFRSVFKPLIHTLSGRDEKVMMKVVVDAADDRLLGVHIVGKDAPEIVQSLAIAMRMGATKADLDATCALHPTTAEELVLLRKPVE